MCELQVYSAWHARAAAEKTLRTIRDRNGTEGQAEKPKEQLNSRYQAAKCFFRGVRIFFTIRCRITIGRRIINSRYVYSHIIDEDRKRNAELLGKVLANPEMVALLSSLAKSLK